MTHDSRHAESHGSNCYYLGINRYPGYAEKGDQDLAPTERCERLMDGSGEPVAIAPAEAEQLHARWSPSGDRILFLQNQNGTTDLRVVPIADGRSAGEPQVVVDAGRMQAVMPQGVPASEEGPMAGVPMGEGQELAWSPDGEQIAFTFSTAVVPADLFVIDLGAAGEASEITRLIAQNG